MNKKIVFLVLILFFLPLVSAVEVNLKSNFSQGETFIAKISGNFFDPISQEDLIFHRNHVRVPIPPFVTKIDDDFYIYAQLFGKQPGNYSLTIENLKYYQVNEIIEEDLVTNFVITEDLSDFLIDPGFILTEDDFSIEFQNLRNEKITILSKLVNGSEKSEGFFDSLFGGLNEESLVSTTLKSGEKKQVNFEISNFNEGLNNLEFSTENTVYSIPVYFFTGSDIGITSDLKLKFEPSELNISFSTDSNLTRIVYLFNRGEDKIENISISLSDNLKSYAQLLTEKIDELDKNSSAKIEVIFTSGSEDKVVEGQIKATSGDLFSNIAVSLNLIKDYIPPENGKVASCLEFGGNLCTEGQECEGDLEYASDGNCCIGTCKDEIKRSSSGKIIGWGLIILVVGYLLWFYLKKYRKVGSVVDILKIAKGKK